MFNLNDTHHEAGIILYGENVVGIFNWGQLDDGYIPMVGPVGMIVPWPVYRDADDEVTLTHVKHVDDVREMIPGTIWTGEDGLETDLDVTYDKFGDLPALWGFGENASVYEGLERPYSGDLWELSTGERVITIDLWN